VAAAKRPIPAGATIPYDDIEKNGRLSLKIWPPHKLPEYLLFDLDSRTRPKIAPKTKSIEKNNRDGSH